MYDTLLLESLPCFEYPAPFSFYFIIIIIIDKRSVI